MDKSDRLISEKNNNKGSLKRKVTPKKLRRKIFSVALRTASYFGKGLRVKILQVPYEPQRSSYNTRL
jgi:hypothetical protein